MNDLDNPASAKHILHHSRAIRVSGRSMDRMTSMATFVKVVESGGFSAAARALGISPSMATAHIQALEERLGVRLLNRSTRKVSLTEVGHAYYERCLQILAE